LLHQAIFGKKMEKGNIWLAGKCGKMKAGEMLRKRLCLA
jgi:hypothetical protein